MTTIEIKQRQLLIQNLSEFGLSNDEASIYLELTRIGSSTSYKLHKITGVGRAVIDKILTSLVEKNLVSQENTNRQILYTAQPYRNLASLVEIREAQVESMKHSLDNLFDNLSVFTRGTQSSDSKVLHYYGEEGLKQLVWNTLRAKKEMRIFEVSRLSAFMQKSFAEKYRMEAHLRGITHYDLTNESYMPGWTDVQEYLNNNQQLRYIDPGILEIKFEIYIYNDVVTMLDYKNNEIIGVEFYNKYLATLQKQLFDYIWKGAIAMKVVGPRGEMKIIN